MSGVGDVFDWSVTAGKGVADAVLATLLLQPAKGSEKMRIIAMNRIGIRIDFVFIITSKMLIILSYSYSLYYTFVYMRCQDRKNKFYPAASFAEEICSLYIEAYFPPRKISLSCDPLSTILPLSRTMI